jgi:BMFP domain-containing protein YqiC
LCAANARVCVYSVYTVGIEHECEDVMNRTQWLEDFQKNLSDLIARSPAADLERNVKAMMGQAFTKMDLITREEFDVQADLLARARERVEQLDAQVRQLEARVAALETRQ